MVRSGTLPDQARLAISFEALFGLLRRLNEPRAISLTASSTLYTLESTGPRRLSDLAIAEGVTHRR